MSKLKSIIEKYNINMPSHDVFVETGLYHGKTLSALYSSGYFNNIDNVYSIEIQKHFVDKANSSFAFLKEEKFNVILGDSSVELEKIVYKHTDESVFFWLFAHYSRGDTGKSEKAGECPLLEELCFIKTLKKKPTIVVDDIRIFIEFPESLKINHNQNDWPSIEQIKERINNLGFDFEIIVDEKLSCLVAS
jgi:hypothetical protein